MWWDYGNWLSDLGNVTSIADNTTVNSTQIENLGYLFMANENQSMSMLNAYGQSRVKYIAVFEVVGIQQSSSGTYTAYPAGYGDEAKWQWMARISGEAQDRLLKQGYMTPATEWTDETSFGGQYTNWPMAMERKGPRFSHIRTDELCRGTYCNTVAAGITITPDQTGTPPTYFKQAHFAGINTSPTQYGGLIPIVAIYEIDWASYNAAMGITP